MPDSPRPSARAASIRRRSLIAATLALLLTATAATHAENAGGTGSAPLRTATEPAPAAMMANSVVAGGVMTGGVMTGNRQTGALQPQPARLPVRLPDALSEADVARYREIFELQRDGQFNAAERVFRTVRNRILAGHVLRQRLLHLDYKASYAELRDWLQRYSDHPDADRIWSLAQKRRPKKAPPPPAPTYGDEAKRAVEDQPSPPPDETLRAQNQLLARATALVRSGRADEAEALLALPASQDLLTPVQHDRAMAEIGMAQFIKGFDERASQIAAGAMRSGDAVPLAYWVAGLTAVRLGDLAAAAQHFEHYALASGEIPWNQAAGAFWAARMHLLTKQPARVEKWLKLAAEHERTFYGLLARRALGINSLLDWSDPLITEADVQRVQALPGGRRALALMQVGEAALADDEIRHAINGADPMLARSIMAVADYTGMPNSAIRSALRLVKLGALPSNRALYPMPPWKPEDGWKLDQALVWGFMRQESIFNPHALSSAGARGLMQLMPATATYIANGSGLPVRDGLQVHDPEYNTALGQAYMAYLMAKPDIDGDLFKLAAAYNGGIGNVRRWFREVKHLDDPLMFIESLPARETRGFIMRVLSNYWIYQQRLGQPTPSLDAVVAGEWPRYIPQDGQNQMAAENARN